VDPEFFLGAAHLMGRELPYLDIPRVRVSNVPKVRKVLPDPVEDPGMKRDELPALLASQCIQREQGGILPGWFRLYSWWQCRRTRILPIYCNTVPGWFVYSFRHGGKSFHNFSLILFIVFALLL
jgi:hypothetical protein